MAIKFLHSIDVDGEVQGTSLDINGNADISGNLTGVDAFTASGKIQGAELEGTSLDINGNGDVSGALNVTGSITTTGAGVNGNLYANRYIQNATGVPTNNLGAPTVTEMALFEQQFKPQTTLANNYNDLTDLRFYKQETSGSSWVEITSYSDDQKRKFLRTMNSSVVIPNTTYKFRVEFVGHNYTFANAVSSYWSSNSHNTQVHVWKRRCSDDLWQQHTSSTTTVGSWPGHMYLPFSTIAWHETNTTSTGHHNAIRIEFTPNWIPYSGSGSDYSANNINIYGLQIWGGYPSGRRTVHNYDQNGKLDLFKDLGLPDNGVATFGNGDDLKIYHDGSNSYISDTGSGHLNIKATNLQLLNAAGNKYYLTGADGNDVKIFHNGVEKFTTKSDGVDIIGELQADSLDIDGNADISGTVTSTNALGFKVDSAASGRIEIESNNNWSYLRLMDNSSTSWDIASYDGGNLEWRPAGSSTNRMTYTSGGVLTTGDGFTSTKGNTAYGWGDHGAAGYLTASSTDLDSRYYTETESDARYLQTETYTAHENISAADSVNGSGRQYIQDITVDSNGHVTGIATATETVTDTNTQNSAATTRAFFSGSGINTSTGVITNTTYTKASSTNLGLVKVGAGITVVADGTISVAVHGNATSGDSGLMSSSDKTKIDTVATNADVTNTTNVTSAGALMDSEVSVVNIKNIDQALESGAEPEFGTANMEDSTNKRFMTDAQETKLDSVATGATANVGDVTLSGTQTISGNKTFSGNTSASGPISQSNTTQSTNKSSGAFKTLGGVGIAKTLNVGEDVVAYASSDKRYKDNLQAITNPIDKVKSLTGYTFTWNDKHEQFNGNDDIGVVAQEVEKVFPEIVDTRDNGYKAVKYEKMVAVLIEAIKDQQKQIDELKEKCNGCSK